MAKYGDVVEFYYGGGRYTAMVVATATKNRIITDEGTAFEPGDIGVLVFGIDSPRTAGEFHPIGRTATLRRWEYNVIR